VKCGGFSMKGYRHASDVGGCRNTRDMQQASHSQVRQIMTESDQSFYLPCQTQLRTLFCVRGLWCCRTALGLQINALEVDV